jgi:hypothetical protein
MPASASLGWRQCPPIAGANCGLFARDQETPVRIGLGGGGHSRDRTGLSPANGENNREFFEYFDRKQVSDAVIASGP